MAPNLAVNTDAAPKSGAAPVTFTLGVKGPLIYRRGQCNCKKMPELCDDFPG